MTERSIEVPFFDHIRADAKIVSAMGLTPLEQHVVAGQILICRAWDNRELIRAQDVRSAAEQALRDSISPSDPNSLRATARIAGLIRAYDDLRGLVSDLTLNSLPGFGKVLEEHARGLVELKEREYWEFIRRAQPAVNDVMG